MDPQIGCQPEPHRVYQGRHAAGWRVRIALVSDVHGNVPALEEVLDDVDRWRPDRVIVNGDVVSRGPSSDAALERVLEAADPERWWFVRGNHEDYVLEHLEPRPHDVVFEINRLSHWTFEQLGPLAAQLADWPLTLEMQDGLRFTHASMKSNRDGIFPFSDDETVRRQIAPPPVLFGCSHVHWPYVRTVDGTLVVNSGSVGSPVDGDVRASYARIEPAQDGWRAEIVRLEYDREAQARAWRDSGCLEASGPVTRLVHHEWARAFPTVGRWFQAYAEPVRRGEIELAEAVDTFLADEA